MRARPQHPARRVEEPGAGAAGAHVDPQVEPLHGPEHTHPAPACEGGAGLDREGALGSLVPSPMTTRREALLSLLLAPAALSCTRTDGAAAAKALKIAVIPKGTTHEFWKSVHAGAAKAAKELGGRHRLEGAPQRGRPQVPDRHRGGHGRAGRGGHRPRAAQRQGARRRRQGGRRRQDPGGHLRLGPPGQRLRELRRHRQRRRRRARRRAPGQAPRRQGQGARAALPGGLGEHRRPRGGLPRRAAQGPRRRRRRLRQPVRRRHDRERLHRRARTCSPPTRPPRAASTASSARTSRPPSACSSRCRRPASPARSSSSASTPPTSSSRACATDPSTRSPCRTPS